MEEDMSLRIGPEKRMLRYIVLGDPEKGEGNRNHLN